MVLLLLLLWEMDNGDVTVSRSYSVWVALGLRAPLDPAPALDLLDNAPGRPVKGLITSLTWLPLRSLPVKRPAPPSSMTSVNLIPALLLKLALWLDMDAPEGVRGREAGTAGAWSRMWSIICSRTARWRRHILHRILRRAWSLGVGGLDGEGDAGYLAIFSTEGAVPSPSTGRKC